MEAIIVMVMVYYSKNTQIRIHHEKRHKVRVQGGSLCEAWSSTSGVEACEASLALPIESHVGLTSPRPIYNNMHMEYCQARKLTQALVSRISTRAWLLKHGRQSVGWYPGTCIPTMDCWCDPRHLDNQDTLVSGRTFQEFRDYLPGAKTKGQTLLWVRLILCYTTIGKY